MKYILKTLLVFFVPFIAIGQTDTLSHKQFVDEYLKHLDKSKIPSRLEYTKEPTVGVVPPETIAASALPPV